jgi:YgiT-type zinc finger domain-containing protein
MEDKCYICGTNMEEKTITTTAGWGKYKFIVTGVKAYVCPKCGEIVFSAKEIHKLQELGKKYKEMLI